MIECERHAGTAARYHCAVCEIGLCEQCARVRSFGASRIFLCPVCRNTIKDLTPYRPVPPFWTTVPDMLWFPFRDQGWMMFGVWALVALLFRAPGEAALGLGNVFGIGALMVYFSLLFSLFYRIEARFEAGKFSLPEWMDFEGFGSFSRPIFNFTAALLGQVWPIPVAALVMRWVSGISFFMWEGAIVWVFLGFVVFFFLADLFLLPMALLTVAVFNNAALAFNPFFLAAQIRKVPREYMIAYGFLLAMTMLYALARISLSQIKPLGSWEGFVIYGLADSLVHLYLCMVAGYLLGYLSYQCRYQLKWWPETESEPVFMVKGEAARPGADRARFRERSAALAALAATAIPAPGPARPARLPDADLEPELAAKLKEAAYLMEHGSFAEAAALLREALSRDPDNFEALRGMVRCSLGLEDFEEVTRHGDAIAAVLVVQGAWEALWDMYEEYKGAMPDFRFGVPELLALAGWLRGRGKYLEAARVFRDLAVSHPGDEKAPEALWKCCELLADKCDKKDTAEKICRSLLKLYPASPEAAQAAEMVVRLEG